jgi:hypothetical protein
MNFNVLNKINEAESIIKEIRDHLNKTTTSEEEIIISPIDNLIKMFFQWKLDMLGNITLVSIAQCMKFKLFYDHWVRTTTIRKRIIK